jgi:hypothetical protein
MMQEAKRLGHNAKHPHPIDGKREGKLPNLQTSYFSVHMFLK